MHADIPQKRNYMRKLYILFFTITLLASCKQEEQELLDDLIVKTGSEKVRIFNTTETDSTTKHFIDFEFEECSRAKTEKDAAYIASRAALVILEKLDKVKLDENEAIRIKFINPNYPNSSANDLDNYYHFDIADLKNAETFIYLSENMIRGYYLGDYSFFIKNKIDSAEINIVDSLLNIALPKSKPMTNFVFFKFATMSDTLGNEYTAILNKITTKDGEQSVTILFNNQTKKIAQIN